MTQSLSGLAFTVTTKTRVTPSGVGRGRFTVYELDSCETCGGAIQAANAFGTDDRGAAVLIRQGARLSMAEPVAGFHDDETGRERCPNCPAEVAHVVPAELGPVELSQEARRADVARFVGELDAMVQAGECAELSLSPTLGELSPRERLALGVPVSLGRNQAASWAARGAR